MIASRSSPRRSGVSLIEVMVALAVFLMCLTAIGKLVDLGGDNALSARYQNTGTRLAKSKMNEVIAGMVAVSSGGSGDFSADGDDGWQWTVTSSATDIANLYSVTVTVSKPFQGRPYEVTLTQTVFDPNFIGTGAEAQPPEPVSGTEGMK